MAYGMGKGIASVTLALLLTGNAVAQQGNSQRLPPAPEPFDQAGAAEKSSGAGYLQRRFGLSEQEAQRRLALQDEAEDFAVQLAESFPEAFLGLDIQQQPYKIVLNMASDEFDQEIRRTMPSSLRSVVQIRRSRFAAGEADDIRAQLIEAMQGLRVSIAFDYSKDRFVVAAPSETQADIRSRLDGRLNALVDIETRPVQSTTQSNATSSDAIYGGWTHYSVDGPQDYCTFAFTVRDQRGTPGLLTAEHCQTTVTERRRNNQQSSGNVITFANQDSSTYYRYGYVSATGRSYDFRLIPAPVVQTGAWVWFSNPRTNTYQKARRDSTAANGWTNDTISYTNQYNGLPTSGYIAVIGTTGAGTTYGVYNPGHPIGSVRCKSGATTGTTCGTITNSSQYFINDDDVIMDGVVQVGNSDFDVIADGGDSGGPIFTEPQWNSAYQRYEIRAAGIMHGATLYNVNPVFQNSGKRPCDNRYDSADCRFSYMPIDRVNDFAPVTIGIYDGNTLSYRAP